MDWRDQECSFGSLEKMGDMESSRRCGVLRRVVECLVSYSVAADGVAAEDIAGEPGSGEQNCPQGTSCDPPELSKRSSVQTNDGVPTGCYAGFPCGVGRGGGASRADIYIQDIVVRK